MTEPPPRVSPLHALTQLARALGRRLSLDDALALIAGHASATLGVTYASVRLLDDDGTRLIATCRVGEAVHSRPAAFALGQGLVGWVAAERAPLRTGDAAADPRFEPRPGMQRPMRSFLGVPILAGEQCIGVLSAVSDEPDRFGTTDEELLVLLAAICAPWVESSRFERMAQIDPLTGALNRRGLDRVYPPDAEAPPQPIAVIAADVDHFKRVNDTFGHAIGDFVLREVVDRIGGRLRATDAIVRMGGEELLVVLPGATTTDAARVAERARQGVRAPIQVEGAEITVTVSFGVAQLAPGENRAGLIARADAALYEAKREGRDRVVVAA